MKVFVLGSALLATCWCSVDAMVPWSWMESTSLLSDEDQQLPFMPTDEDDKGPKRRHHCDRFEMEGYYTIHSSRMSTETTSAWYVSKVYDKDLKAVRMEAYPIHSGAHGRGSHVQMKKERPEGSIVVLQYEVWCDELLLILFSSERYVHP